MGDCCTPVELRADAVSIRLAFGHTTAVVVAAAVLFAETVVVTDTAPESVVSAVWLWRRLK